MIWCRMFFFFSCTGDGLTFKKVIHNGLLRERLKVIRFGYGIPAGKVLIVPWPLLLRGCQHLVFFLLPVRHNKQPYVCI